jgi:hypothetical protein
VDAVDAEEPDIVAKAVPGQRVPDGHVVVQVLGFDLAKALLILRVVDRRSLSSSGDPIFSAMVRLSSRPRASDCSHATVPQPLRCGTVAPTKDAAS